MLAGARDAGDVATASPAANSPQKHANPPQKHAPPPPKRPIILHEANSLTHRSKNRRLNVPREAQLPGRVPERTVPFGEVGKDAAQGHRRVRRRGGRPGTVLLATKRCSIWRGKEKLTPSTVYSTNINTINTNKAGEGERRRADGNKTPEKVGGTPALQRLGGGGGGQLWPDQDRGECDHGPPAVVLDTMEPKQRVSNALDFSFAVW